MNAKITIVVPCALGDIPLAHRLLRHLAYLDPPPFNLQVYYNQDGYRLAQINAIEKGFESSDLVLRLAVDVWPSHDFLRYVSPIRVTSFNGLTMTRSDLTMQLLRLLHYSKGWTGVFSLDRETWGRVKPDWNGLDYHMRVLVGRNNYRFVGNLKFRLIRRYEAVKTRALLNTMSKKRRFWWQLSRLRPVRLN